MTRVVGFVFAVSLAAQQSQFGVRSRMVIVPVTVTDSKGRPIDGLREEDFQLFDNGRPRNIIVDTLDTGVAPIALIVAVQSSGISAAVLEKTRRIGGMIQPLISGARGCAGLVSFDQRVNWLQECTANSDAFESAFRQLTPLLRPGEDKEARMLDAAQSAIEHLKKNSGSRRVLLLISESRDRGSESALESVAMAAQAADVTVYAATYSALKTAFTSKAPVSEPRRPVRPPRPSDELGDVNGSPPGKNNPYPKMPPAERQVDAIGGIRELARLNKTNTAVVLAKSTGGVTYSFTRQKALEEALLKLGGELHSEYILSFAPEALAQGTPSAYHTIEVKLAKPGGFHVRARPGYWWSE